MKWLLMLVLVAVPVAASAAGITVTPEMRRVMIEKMTEQCLRQEGEFAKKGYSRAQTMAICKCSMQQTGALLNSQTVGYILTHGVMPADMQHKVNSATGACIKSVISPRRP